MKKTIMILGAWNTGTNLISKILSNSYCVFLNNETEFLDISNNNVWKHEPIFSVVENMIMDPNKIVVIMYRNVYSWLKSMQKSSYELEFKNIQSIAKINKRDINISFRNILFTYNHYYTNYIRIINTYPNVVFFDYKKIVDENIAFDYINFKLSKLNLKIKEKYKVIQQLIQPSKNHGKPVKNSAEALQKYNTTISLMKEELNKFNMQKFVNNDIIDFFENDYIR
jgi:hypothetical protein